MFGNVSNIKQNKGHVLLNLNSVLSLGDTVEFEKEHTRYTISELMIKNKNIQIGNKGQLVEIGRMKGNINIGDKVFKVASKELSNLAFSSYQKENKKIFLNASISLKKDKPVSLNISTIDNDNYLFDDINISFLSEEIPVEAKNKPISKEKIIEQLSKTTDTIFTFKDIKVELDDNLFLPSVKALNELRRTAIDKLLSIAQNRITRKEREIELLNNKIIKEKNEKRKISLLLNKINLNYDYTNLNNIDNIYIPLKYFADKKYEKIVKDITLKYKTYIYLPTIIKNNYKKLLNNFINIAIDNFNFKGFVISNLGNITFLEDIKEKYNKLEFIGNYTLNIYNSYSIAELKELGLSKLTISPELDLETINSINKYSQLDQELIVYGRIPLMNANYCFLGNTNKCYPTCKMYCKQDKSYYLKDRMGLIFPVIPDNIQTVTTIYNSKITSIVGQDFNVSSYRIDILDENVDQINAIIETVLSNKRLEGKEYTNGNLNREI